MKNLVCGCLLLLVALAGAIVLGGVADSIVAAFTANERIATVAAVSVFLLSFLLLVNYGGLFLYWVGFIRDDAAATSARQRRRRQQEDGKLRTLELRGAFVFAIVGYASASVAGASTPIIVALAVVLGTLGGLVGHDIKRRTTALREGRRRSTEEDATDDPRASDNP